MNLLSCLDTFFETLNVYYRNCESPAGLGRPVLLSCFNCNAVILDIEEFIGYTHLLGILIKFRGFTPFNTLCDTGGTVKGLSRGFHPGIKIIGIKKRKSAKKVEMAENFRKIKKIIKKSIQSDPESIPYASCTFLTQKQHFKTSFSLISGHFR